MPPTPSALASPDHHDPAPHGSHVEELLEQAAVCRRHRRLLLSEAIVAALPLADGVAARYTGRGAPFDDLQQVARLGLVKAVYRYDPGRRVSFSAYALPTVAGEVRRHFRDHEWVVRPPRRLQELRQQLARAREDLTHQLGREPEPKELAEWMGALPHEVQEAAALGRSYRTGTLEDHAGHIAAELRVPDPSTHVVELEVLRQALGRLTRREFTLLRLRFVEELSQAQIGAMTGLSQAHVSRLLERTLRRLRRDLDPTGEDGTALAAAEPTALPSRQHA